MLRTSFRLITVGAAISALASACVITEIGEDTDDNNNDYIDGLGDPSEISSGSGETGSGNPSGGSTGDPMNPPDTQSPGDLCNCDSECAAVDALEGICVFGVCMTRPGGECASAGSTAECNGGSRCWSMDGAGSICFPDCNTFECDSGTCDSDGSCVPNENTSCDYSCGAACACETGDCAENETCISGTCVPQVATGDGPGAGPGPICNNLPKRDCTGDNSYCGELVVFDPRTTSYYDDYALNGETTTNQYRSFLRRDLAMLVAYATAKVECKAAGWPADWGNGGALGLGDMSEANGAIPGTAVGSPGHPASTHTDGFDIDLAYYQVNTPDNKLRPVCPSQDYHCSAPPHLMDLWRTSLFLGAVFESDRVRVVGVDGQVGPLVTSAINQLCQDGWLDAFACSHVKLAYETTNMNYGWFYFHHHHAHISMCPGNVPCNNVHQGLMASIGPGHVGMKFKPHPYPFGVPAL